MPPSDDRPGDTGSTVVRLSALCGRAVVDDEGRDVGRVLDVRTVQDGRLLDGTTAALRVDGLIVGTHGWIERFGLVRNQVRGPWLLVAPARRLNRTARYLAWEQVADPQALADPAAPVRFRGELQELRPQQT